MILERKRRHLERYLEIGRILAKHGWESLLSRIGLAGIFSLRARRAGVPPGPVQVRETLEELGPTFVKLGQVLSTRPDVIPADYAAELEKLQDEALPFPSAEAVQVIEEDLGQPINQLFRSFNDHPFAAASLGQTHYAILTDGTPVVVKVQRPGIRQVIENDLEMLAGIARLLESRSKQARLFGLTDLAEEFSITLRQELDYAHEGRNGDIFKANFAEVPSVRMAGTIWDRTTSRVLTSDRISGIKVTDLQALDAHGYNRTQIADNLSRAIFKMVFVDGFFHADPHPGNLLVLDESVVAFVDYGMVGKLDRQLKAFVTMLITEYIQQDSAGFSEVLLAMGTAPTDLDRKRFTQEIDRILRQYYGAPLRDVRIGEILKRAIQISSRHNVRLPASLSLLVKVIIIVEGIDLQLNPDFDFASEARPYIARSVQDELKVSTLKEQTYHTLLYWKWLLLELPHRTSEVLDRMAEGAFRVIFKHEGLEDPMHELDRSANRLSFALMSSAIIIGSALIISSKVGPLWRGYSILGIIGFGLSFVLAAWLMISIIRAGKLW
ncbi:MAG TPA: AarF/ABC1/UbiB kinase family protein [Armatimonadota bacterium]|nr:AarF/ABC1/UbiB kinase family protein [Armatimonadota bacterium]